MTEAEQIFGKAFGESNLEQVRKAAVGMFQIYEELQKAGFDKAEAMTIMITMTQKKPEG